MSPSSRRATSHDVARLAGVSQSTVSRALRGLGGMSPETRQRVEQAARQLAYVPFEAGRSLVTRATRRVGVVAGDLTNPFFPDLVEPMRAELEHRGYRTVLIPDSVESPADVQVMTDGSLDGVILTTARMGSRLPHQLADAGVPFVFTNREIHGFPADACVADNRLGAVATANLLVDLGHRAVGAILGPSDTSNGREREAGLLEGLNARGLYLDPARVRRGEFDFDTGYRASLDLLANTDRTSAIVCSNDVVALGACNAVMKAGLAVGRDMTIVGFDNIRMAGWPVFGLTTVGCDLTKLAAESVRLLMLRIQDPTRSHTRVVLDVNVVERASHGTASVN
jgi:LacI family transcriptional regulator